MVDSRGVIHSGRTAGINEYKARFIKETDARTLTDAMTGADVFLGLSVADSVTPDMVKRMADQPIIFAMANPDPEIDYELAKQARPDAIIATGRSDYPNQVNNVLGFPFIFRGALDAEARQINDDMKLAAAQALADLTHEDIPDSVLKAYNLTSLKFGPEYIIPKPFDPRALLWVAPAVVEAAMKSGVARRQLDLKAYREQLEALLGKGWQLMRHIINKACYDPKRVVLGEGDEPRMIRAAAIIEEEGIGQPILLGNPQLIRERIRELGLDYEPTVIEPAASEHYEDYSQELFELRQRKGMTLSGARDQMSRRRYFGLMMVRRGDADAYVSGLCINYLDVLRPALQVIGPAPNVQKVAAMYIIIVRDKVYFFVDATVNINPNAEELAQIAGMAADAVRRFDIEPRVAMLSFSNFGSTRHPFTEKVQQAVKILHQRRPDLAVDGEMMADTAVLSALVDDLYPFSQVREANVMVFPDLQAANIAYKLMQRVGGAESIGPVLMGMDKSVHILQGSEEEVRDIVNMAAMAVIDAQ